MKQLVFLGIAAGLLVAGLMASQSVPKPRPPVRPNVIFILADDLGYGELGCYGQQKIKTPHLDRMAREGLRFTQFYVGAPVCAPSRCQLLTGLHGGHAYIRGNYELGGFADSLEGGQMPLHPSAFTIGHLMQRAGYRTACIGKWGLGMHNTTGNPNQQGFDQFYGYLCQKQAHNYYPTHLWENGRAVRLQNSFIDVHRKFPAGTPDSVRFAYPKGREYAVDKMAEQTRRFLTENRQRPFFLYIALPLPHLSLQAPDAAVRAYAGQFTEQPYRSEGGYSATPSPKATYAAMISYFDQQVGQVLAQVKALGLDDNTLVMVSSDNGATFVKAAIDTEFFRSVGDLRGLKMEVYEGGIRVPMLARWPGHIRAGQTTDHVGANYDLLATLADLTGTRPPATDGISFLPTLLGQVSRQAVHPFLYVEYPENGGQLAVRLGRWKAVRRDVRRNPTGRWELYDLTTDQGEQHDLANEHPEVLRQCDAIVSREHRPAHIREWEFVDPKI